MDKQLAPRAIEAARAIMRQGPTGEQFWCDARRALALAELAATALGEDAIDTARAALAVADRSAVAAHERAVVAAIEDALAVLALLRHQRTCETSARVLVDGLVAKVGGEL
jgi:hypothetical protein